MSIFRIDVDETLIEFNVDFKDFSLPKFFDGFLTANPRKSDITFYLREFELHPRKTISIGEAAWREIERKCVFFQEDIKNKSCLCNPKVFHRLYTRCRRNAGPIWVDVQDSSVTVMDLYAGELDIFYSSEIRDIVARFHSVHPFFAPFFSFFSKALIHGSCLVLGEKAALFLGSDEAGKSTVIRNARDGICLSDDHILLKRKSNDFIASGTPWGLISTNNLSAPVGGIFMLEKSGAFELIPSTKTSTIKFLWNEHLSYYCLLPKEIKTAIFNLFCDLCSSVPSFIMRFPKDFVDWPAIHKALYG